MKQKERHEYDKEGKRRGRKEKKLLFQKTLAMTCLQNRKAVRINVVLTVRFSNATA